MLIKVHLQKVNSDMIQTENFWKTVTTAAETYSGERRSKVEEKIEGVEGEVNV
jgi:hypothetical protein